MTEAQRDLAAELAAWIGPVLAEVGLVPSSDDDQVGEVCDLLAAAEKRLALREFAEWADEQGPPWRGTSKNVPESRVSSDGTERARWSYPKWFKVYDGAPHYVYPGTGACDCGAAHIWAAEAS